MFSTERNQKTLHTVNTDGIKANPRIRPRGWNHLAFDTRKRIHSITGSLASMSTISRRRLCFGRSVGVRIPRTSRSVEYSNPTLKKAPNPKLTARWVAPKRDKPISNATAKTATPRYTRGKNWTLALSVCVNSGIGPINFWFILFFLVHTPTNATKGTRHFKKPGGNSN